MEVIFLLGVVIVLAAVAIGPVQVERHARSIAHGVESARTLNTLLGQYATDNNGVYPVGEGTRSEGKSEGIALDLLLNNYTPNADVFAVGSTPRYRGTAKDYADLAPENMSWDFTAGANATTGITTAASDLLPIVYTTGETLGLPGTSLPVPGVPPDDVAPDVGLSGNGPFAGKGMIVAYKGGSAVFLTPETKFGGAIPICFGVVSPKLKDSGTYTQIRP